MRYTTRIGGTVLASYTRPATEAGDPTNCANLCGKDK